MMPKELIISRIRKSAANEVWIILKKYKGKDLCDIREYFMPDNSPDWLPTKKGVSIPLEMLPEIVDAAEEMAATSTVGVIAELDRGEITKICLSIREFRKHVYGDIRIFYRADEEADNWKPGKGVTLPLSKLGPLVEALRMAEDNVDRISN